MKYISPDRARKILSQNLKFAPQNAVEAKVFLKNYENDIEKIPENNTVLIYLALQTLACEGMGDKPHCNDIKREQRAQGKQNRKARTGSRKG